MVITGYSNITSLSASIVGSTSTPTEFGFSYRSSYFVRIGITYGYVIYGYTDVYLKSVNGTSYIDHIECRTGPAGNISVSGTFTPDSMTLADFQYAAASGASLFKALFGREAITAYDSPLSQVSYGGVLADQLYGGAGYDTLIGGPAGDLLDGGADVDTASYIDAAAGVVARLDAPTYNTGDAAGDTYVSIEALEGSLFDDTLVGDGGGNQLVGLDGSDILIGLDGADTLRGGNGADHLIGGAGSDLLDGGDGYDYARYDYATGPVGVRLDIPSYNSGEAAGDTYIDIEGVVGSAYNDVLVGNAGGNTLIGQAGDDVLYGQEGNDGLVGGEGSDQFYGGAGTDYIEGGAGFDYARYDYASSAVAIDLSTGIGSAGEANGDYLTNVEGLVGSYHDDYLVGSAGANIIYGLGGNDILFGGQGADTLNGGTGADTFAFYAADLQSGVYNRVADFNGGEGDAITFVGVDAATTRYFDTPNGALITTAGTSNGGVIVDNVTLAQLSGHVFFT